MKTLFLIRHAKSSWDDASLSDFERPLNERGYRDAPIMAKVLKEKGFIPDLILSSPAHRAKTTAQFMIEGLHLSTDCLVLSTMIYEASFEHLFQIINGIDDQYNTVFLVGHNPSFTYLAENLGDSSIGNLPTCGIVGLNFELDSWKHVSSGLGTQFYFDYPKNHL